MSSNEEYIKKNKVILVDDDKNTKLHYATATNNVLQVEKEIALKKKLDPENYLGWTPLMMAVKNANFYIVNLLLTSGADATKKNKFGMTVFLISVTCGDLDILQKLLDHLLCGGVSRRSLQKVFSPISLAILFDQPHIFKYLLERSFDVNAQTPLTGITPLMCAAAIGNTKAFKKLIQSHADINLANCIGRTAPEILQTRQHKIDIDVSGSKRKTNLPVIVLSAPTPANSPYLQLTPFLIDSAVQGGVQNLRRSSDTQSPHIIGTPGVSPITPYILRQMFFGPDFSQNKFMSPSVQEFLNARLTSTAFVSPMPYSNYV